MEPYSLSESRQCVLSREMEILPSGTADSSAGATICKNWRVFAKKNCMHKPRPHLAHSIHSTYLPSPGGSGIKPFFFTKKNPVHFLYNNIYIFVLNFAEIRNSFLNRTYIGTHSPDNAIQINLIRSSLKYFHYSFRNRCRWIIRSHLTRLFFFIFF